MAINSLDDLIAALPGQYLRFYRQSAGTKGAGYWHSLWRVPGFPGAPTSNPPTGNGEVPTKSTAGALPLVNASGSNKLYIANAFAAFGTGGGSLIFYDRLWHNSGFVGNSTSVQSISTPPTLTRGDTNGTDVELWLEVYTAFGSTATTITATYVNQNGDTGRSATISTSGMGAPVAGQIIPFNLQTGDTGVRTVSSVQLSASTGSAGDFGLVLLRRLVEIPYAYGATGGGQDAFSAGLPEVPNDACIAALMLCSTSSTGAVYGSLRIVEG